MRFKVGFWPAVAILTVLVALIGDPREVARSRGARLHISVATGGTGGVWYPYGGALARIISRNVRNTEATAEVTAASVDNLRFLAAGTADVAFTMADALADAAAGTGPFRESGRVPARALASLYNNHLHVIARRELRIENVADLRGRVVSVGSPGSGTETMALRVLAAAGIDPSRDIRAHGLGASQSVDAFKDRKLDAFFWAGGIPTGAILDLMSSQSSGARFIEAADLVPVLSRLFGDSLYFATIIPRGAYPNMDRDVATIGVSNVLVVNRSMSNALAYEITRALFTHRDELVAVHPEARHLDRVNAVRSLPVPLHPGAERFYREAGVIR